jgi:hypothetical protein
MAAAWDVVQEPASLATQQVPQQVAVDATASARQVGGCGQRNDHATMGSWRLEHDHAG